MVEEIYNIKNQFVERMRSDIEDRGIERVDVGEMYKLADIVKDLAEAEKACWEAEYYRSVSEAMEGGSGYPMSQGYSSGPGGTRGGSGGNQGGRMGWQNQYGSGPSRTGGRRGYGMGYDLAGLKEAMRNAEPQERERMMQELRQMIGGQM